MRPKTKKIIVFSLLAVLLTAAGVAYYFYNKGPRDIKTADGKKVGALELYQAFTKDSVSAKKDFIDKVLEVTGEVTGVSTNQQSQPIVLLKTGTEGASVNCTLEGEAGSAAVGNKIVLKGICSGMGEGDKDMGIPGDVYLTRCYTVK